MDGMLLPPDLGSLPEFAQPGDAVRPVTALVAVLRATGWQGSPQDVREAMPVGEEPLSFAELCDTLARLGYGARIVHKTRRNGRLDEALLTRLAPQRDGRPLPLLALTGAGAGVLQAEGRLWSLRRPDGSAHPVSAAPKAEALAVVRVEALTAPAPAPSWLRTQMRASFGLMAPALVLTVAANLAALASPIFTMAVYDRVIASGSVDSLAYLAMGALGAAAFEAATRSARGRIMAHVGLRLGYGVGNRVFAKLLDLPAATTERLNVSSQVARVKDIDRVRELFAGTLEQTLMDLPFALMFIAAIGILGGWIAVVPAIAVLLFAAAAPLGNAVLRARAAAAARAGARRQAVMLELTERMRAIRAGGNGMLWLERVRSASEAAAKAGEAHSRASFAMATLGQVLTSGAGLAALVWGVHLVLAGALTTGGLIACMMLVWRLLGPVQMAFVSSTRLGQIAASIRQIDNLMRNPDERETAPAVLPLRVTRGDIAFSRVTFRYGRESEPTLGNLAFQADPGEVVAILGKNGGGKSTVLKLLSGLYTPQGGTIRIDGRDMRQYSPAELRRAITYVPQVPQFFHGTLLENLQMLAPDATYPDILQALESASALEAVMGLPDGLETRFDSVSSPLPAGLMMRLTLARLYLRSSPIVLLDEPATGLDMEGEFSFIGALAHLRNRGATVFMVTHRRQYLAVADKVLVLEGGTARYFGTAEKVRDRIPRGMI